MASATDSPVGPSSVRAGRFFPSIQYLRAVAALLVVAYHVVNHWLPGYLGHDYVLMGGVDIFFVISGFVMWCVTTDRDGGPLTFFGKRVRRIVPLYWIVTTVMLAVALSEPALLNTRFDAAHVVASYAFVPWRHPVKNVYEPLLIPGWTLNYEMAFYVVFALILLAPRRFRLTFCVGVFAVVVAVGQLAHPGGALGFYTDPIILEFAMGLCLGAAVTTGRRVPARLSAVIALTGVGLFVAAAGTGLLFHRVFMLGVPAVLLVGGCVFFERERGPRLVRWPLLLGDASYSVYLVHMSSALIVYRLWSSVGALHNAVGVLAAMVAALTASAAVGVLVYTYVERPVTDYVNLLAFSRRSAARTQSTLTQSTVDRNVQLTARL